MSAATLTRNVNAPFTVKSAIEYVTAACRDLTTDTPTVGHPINPEDLVAAAGGTVHTRRGQATLTVYQPGDFIITVADTDPTARRWKVAHALAVYLLHYQAADRAGYMSVNLGAAAPTMSPAKTAAAHLLIPPRRLSRNPRVVARNWDVPEGVARLRLVA